MIAWTCILDLKHFLKAPLYFSDVAESEHVLNMVLLQFLTKIKKCILNLFLTHLHRKIHNMRTTGCRRKLNLLFLSYCSRMAHIHWLVQPSPPPDLPEKPPVSNSKTQVKAKQALLLITCQSLGQNVLNRYRTWWQKTTPMSEYSALQIIAYTICLRQFWSNKSNILNFFK